jgi:hypothetical protein
LHKGNRPTLEIIGFDFEYYKKDPKDAERTKQSTQRYKESGKGTDMQASRGSGERAIYLAASYSMLEQLGWNLPPKKDVQK